MKKYLLAGAVIALFVIYSIHQRNEGTEAVNAVNNSVQNLSTQPTQTPSSGASGTPTNTNGTYKDGTYTGKVADAFYGNIQVQATVSGGKLTDVQFLQYPNDRRDSVEINTQAMPMWKQEAIQAQSANVDIVSGATDSSKAFIESLQSALDQAKA